MFGIALRVVGSIQIVLGLAYLLAPNVLLLKMGHSLPAVDLLYPFGMLSSRFLAYGIGLWIISVDPGKHILWIRLMAFIQLIDLAVGAFYTVTDVVPLSLSAFPMFNALWIGLLFAFWRPALSSGTRATQA
ncbi:hypothetical protein [Ferrovum sp.]|jgi:hypothetical protein|uniref:hypothetical protein n=1 Tax=Ferrovum sp. TaxID=2609467 RepID=UPI002630A295|nr:hypothetical protein [Ferrovum sp.]